MSHATYVLDPDVKTRSTEQHNAIVQQFEISDPVAKVCWYKDGTRIYPKRETGSKEPSQILPFESQPLSDDGMFGCVASDGVLIKEDMKGVVPRCTCTFKNQ